MVIEPNHEEGSERREQQRESWTRVSVTRLREINGYTWLQVSALERKIVHIVGGGPVQLQSRTSTTMTRRVFSSRGNIQSRNTHLDCAFDLQASSQSDPNENRDSSTSNHVDSEPNGANAAFKKPYFGRGYGYHEQRVRHQDLERQVSRNAELGSQRIVLRVFSTFRPTSPAVILKGPT
jgi:hypothetical protein